MKNVFLVFVFLFLTRLVSAQDYIVKRNGEEIYCIIKEITVKEVKYIDSTISATVLRSINKSDVLFIRYRNGVKEVFEGEIKKEDVVVKKQSNIDPVTGIDNSYPIIDLGSNDYSVNGKIYSLRQIKILLVSSNDPQIRKLLILAKVNGVIGNVLAYSSIPIGYIGLVLGAASQGYYGDPTLAPIGVSFGIICIGANVGNILLKINKRKKIAEAIKIYNSNIDKSIQKQ